MSGSVGKELANRDNAAADSQPLSMLSAVASMVSEEDPPKDMMQIEERHYLPPSMNLVSAERSGQLSRSLSRTSSSRNLMQEAAASAPTFPRQSMGSGQLSNSLSRSSSSRNLLQQAATTSSAPLSRKRRRLNDMQICEADTSPHISGAPLATPGTVRFTEKSYGNRFEPPKTTLRPKTVSFDTSSTVSNSDSSQALSFSTHQFQRADHTPSEEILNNVYRVHEIRLPEQLVMSRIVQGQNSKEEAMDDYNYDITTNNPLQMQPRLPTATESFAIAEKSLEQKDTWGWYAE